MLRGFGFSRVPPVFPWCIVITLLRCITTKSLRYSVFPQPVPKRAFGWNRTSPIALALALPSKLQRHIPRQGQEKNPRRVLGRRRKNGGNGMEAHPRYDRSEKSLLGCTSIFIFYKIIKIPQLVKTKCCLFYAVSILFYHFSPFPFWVFTCFLQPPTDSATVPSPAIPSLLPGIYAFKRCPAF